MYKHHPSPLADRALLSVARNTHLTLLSSFLHLAMLLKLESFKSEISLGLG